MNRNNNIYDFPSGDDLRKLLKKFKGFLILLVLVIIIAIAGTGSFYTIKEQEQAVVTTFGRAKTVSEAGLHFKIPVIQKVQKVDTTIKGLAIGYDEMTGQSIEVESMMITKDFNFVNVDFYVEYQVSDPIKFLYASADPVTILKNIAQSHIRTIVGSYNVDSVITDGKYEIQSKIKETIIEKLLERDIGLMLVNITIQDSEPPTEQVMEAFKSVETAKQGKETAINNATKYKNEKLPQAEAEVDKILQQAEATKTKRINEAEAEVARFNEMYEEYKKYPLITKERMFYEAMEDILPSMKVIIDSGTDVSKILPLESFTGGN
ncbi:MAG: FtsH protease activity modulator HflK [Clostridiales bacterium]|nr:FtsH protease activity modulator HflK [Clostridiales bacterium]